MPPLSNGTWKGSEGDTAMAFVDGELRLYKFHDGEWRELPKLDWHPHTSDWYEPWCEDHPDGDNGKCLSCVGQSHDAWMHRTKAAEHYLREARALLFESLHMAASTEDFRRHTEAVNQLLEETKDV